MKWGIRKCQTLQRAQFAISKRSTELGAGDGRCLHAKRKTSFRSSKPHGAARKCNGSLSQPVRQPQLSQPYFGQVWG